MISAPQDVVIVGAGHLGLLLHDCLEGDPRWRCVGFIDDGQEGTQIRGLPIFSTEAYERRFCEKAFLAVGFPKLRQHMVERLKSKSLRWETFVDRRSMVGGGAVLGQGVLILNYATIASDTALEDFVYISNYAGAGTGSRVGAFTAVLAGAMIGGCVIGEACVIGIRSTCLNINIGDEAVISPHSWVRRDVPAGALAAGSPARVASKAVDQGTDAWAHDRP